ncbi:sodium channel protein Nach isoform X2 [Phlebotomus argentipes]|uniref:sodium channel protein Nach isoform X2 n=1 Tax=Phlebotomus argentipes TaxID=94469 RepID=UPI0028936BFA|nr:sodium channel protein Nach isoform X2 [Phlebotomus argentipes]
MGFRDIWKEYMKNSSLHGAKFIVDERYQHSERFFWVVCVFASWMASGLLIRASLDAFQNNAISFVVETSFLNWKTHFPSIAVCETKNSDKIQEISELLWGVEHDFTLEEVLSEITYFRGESYHLVHECASDEPIANCLFSDYIKYARLVRSDCSRTLKECQWNGERKFNCCDYFFPMDSELGTCYAINSIQTENPKKMKMPMISDKYSGPGRLTMEILTEANIYILGEEDVPHLVTPKSEMLAVTPHISYYRQITMKNIENDPETRDVNVAQRSCRYPDENILDVHESYSYSACSVQCRKDAQLKICNCTSHLMPNVSPHLHCNISGLKCLNEHYEELSIVIPKWSSHGRKGVVCDCLPSCTEIDVSIVHDSKNKGGNHQAVAQVEIELSALPTERYKRNVVRGRLDLVVSMGGTTGLFVGASLLSFVEILYYFTIRPYGNFLMKKHAK